MALNRYSEAVTCSDQILKLFPQNADALNNRGVCLMALERYAEAIDCFEKALKLNPNDADIFINKGCALMVLEKYNLRKKFNLININLTLIFLQVS